MKEIAQLKEADVIKWLAHRRQENGISIEKLSEESGLRAPLIQKIEQTGRIPSETIFWTYIRTVCKLTGGTLNVE